MDSLRQSDANGTTHEKYPAANGVRIISTIIVDFVDVELPEFLALASFNFGRLLLYFDIISCLNQMRERYDQDKPMDPFSIEFRAINPERNCYRTWRIDVSTDLFGLWVAQVFFGRTGRGGRLMNYRFDSLEPCIQFVRKSVRKRRNAKSRIGVNYVCFAVSGNEHQWL